MAISHCPKSSHSDVCQSIHVMWETFKEIVNSLSVSVKLSRHLHLMDSWITQKNLKIRKNSPENTIVKIIYTQPCHVLRVERANQSQGWTHVQSSACRSNVNSQNLYNRNIAEKFIGHVFMEYDTKIINCWHVHWSVHPCIFTSNTLAF